MKNYYILKFYTFIKQVVIILCLICFISCNRKSEINEKNEGIPINIEIKDSYKINLSDFVDSFYFVKLSQEKTIGKITKLTVIGDKIFLLDTYKSKSLLIANKKGQIINSISKVGNGPGEFKTPDDFYYDQNRNFLFINDLNQRKLIKYDINGKFISQSKYDNPFISFVTNKTDGFVTYQMNLPQKKSNRFNIFIVNEDLKIRARLFPYIKEKEIPQGTIYALKYFNEELLFLPPICNKIYSLALDFKTPHVKYSLLFGNDWAPESFFSNYEPKKQFEFVSKYYKSGYVNSTDFFETNSILYITFYKKNQLFYSIYNKITKKNICFSKYNDDIAMGLFLNPIYAYEDYFISIVEPSELKEAFYKLSDKQFKNSNNYSQLKKITESITGIENPILLYYKLKKNF